MGAGVLVAWHFRDSQAPSQGLDDHLLLDGGHVLAQVELPEDGCPYRAEAVLAVAQPAVEPPVDAGGDERAAGEAEELVEPAVQLARPTPEPRRGDMVRLVAE